MGGADAARGRCARSKLGTRRGSWALSPPGMLWECWSGTGAKLAELLGLPRGDDGRL